MSQREANIESENSQGVYVCGPRELKETQGRTDAVEMVQHSQKTRWMGLDTLLNSRYQGEGGLKGGS